jgi:glutamate synthase (NADPH/NADH) large chain
MCARYLSAALTSECKDELAFERKLYVIRKRAELAIRYGGAEEGRILLRAELILSSKIVYKGMLTTVAGGTVLSRPAG